MVDNDSTPVSNLRIFDDNHAGTIVLDKRPLLNDRASAAAAMETSLDVPATVQNSRDEVMFTRIIQIPLFPVFRNTGSDLWRLVEAQVGFAPISTIIGADNEHVYNSETEYTREQLSSLTVILSRRAVPIVSGGGGAGSAFGGRIKKTHRRRSRSRRSRSRSRRSRSRSRRSKSRSRRSAKKKSVLKR